ncbi:MAG: hypothetical protein KF774_03735 [Planctomyces sp.]|nr:hypothetical protein [Planctomyces sp.]
MKKVLTLVALGLGIATFGMSGAAKAGDDHRHQFQTVSHRGVYRGPVYRGPVHRGHVNRGWDNNRNFRNAPYGGWGYSRGPRWGAPYVYGPPVYRNGVIITTPGFGFNYYGW